MKHLFALLLVLCSSISVFGITAREIFAADSVGAFNILAKNTKLDMLDYYDNGRSVGATNIFEGTCSLDTVTPQFISVNLTDASDVQIWVNDTVSPSPTVVINHTYLTPVADGTLEFFNADLTPKQASKIIEMPTIADFIVIPKGDKKKKSEVLATIDMPFISYDIDSTDGTITATQNMAEFLGDTDYKPLKPYLIPEIHYHWNGKRYIKQ